MNEKRRTPIARDLQVACAIAHGKGTKMSVLELCALILEDGLPSRAERERLVKERLASQASWEDEGGASA